MINPTFDIKNAANTLSVTKAEIDAVCKLPPQSNKELLQWQARELLLCRQNPFYFIYNYVKLPILADGLPLTEELLHPKMKRVVKILYRYNRCVLMASRQRG